MLNEIDLKRYLFACTRKDKCAYIFWDLPDGTTIAFSQGWRKLRRYFPEPVEFSKETDYGWEQIIDWKFGFELLAASGQLNEEPEESSQI